MSEPQKKKTLIPSFRDIKARGEKLTMITVYDYPFARLVDRSPAEMILVGDSGEKDPEIYREVKRRHKDRVLLAAIHRVTNEKASAARFSGQVLFKSYKKLARELHRRKLLTRAEYRTIKKQK